MNFSSKISLSIMGGLLIMMAFLTSCGNEKVKKKEVDPTQFKQQLEKVNKYEIEKEADEINQYLLRHQWSMERTGTGLRYLFIKKGEGDSARAGNIVRVNYRISLLDGTECYSSEKDGAYEFKVEGDAIESGLHEAIQLMRVGDKAKFILPFYMAHGLHGDDANIPPLATIVADIELLEIR
jgi:FKBP-type peptidyl-prolyl cis-trans isomerase FkpA